MSDDEKPDDMPELLWDMRRVYKGGREVRADRCTDGIKKLKAQMNETPAKFLADLNALERKYLDMQALRAKQAAMEPVVVVPEEEIPARELYQRIIDRANGVVA